MTDTVTLAVFLKILNGYVEEWKIGGDWERW